MATRELEALRDLRAACEDAYKAGRIPAEPFVRAGNVLAEARDGFSDPLQVDPTRLSTDDLDLILQAIDAARTARIGGMRMVDLEERLSTLLWQEKLRRLDVARETKQAAREYVAEAEATGPAEVMRLIDSARAFAEETGRSPFDVEYEADARRAEGEKDEDFDE